MMFSFGGSLVYCHNYLLLLLFSAEWYFWVNSATRFWFVVFLSFFVCGVCMCACMERYCVQAWLTRAKHRGFFSSITWWLIYFDDNANHHRVATDHVTVVVGLKNIFKILKKLLKIVWRQSQLQFYDEPGFFSLLCSSENDISHFFKIKSLLFRFFQMFFLFHRLFFLSCFCFFVFFLPPACTVNGWLVVYLYSLLYSAVENPKFRCNSGCFLVLLLAVIDL